MRKRSPKFLLFPQKGSPEGEVGILTLKNWNFFNEIKYKPF